LAYAEDKKKCIESGMNEVLTKPISRAALSNTLLHYAQLVKFGEVNELKNMS